MRSTAFIGIDIGTQDIRGVLVDADGEILADQHRTITVGSPQAGFAEHDPERDWWNNVCAISRALLEAPHGPLAGVGVAGLFPATVTLDRHHRPVGPAILYHDSRAEREVEEVAEASGQALTGDEVIPNLLWLSRHQPALFEQVRTVVSSAGYVVSRLTDQQVIDPHNAYRFGGIADDTRVGWREDLLEALGLPGGILPGIRRSTDVIGTVTDAANQMSGLPAGTPVITGTTDTFATLVGNGVIDAGDAMIYYGSTGLLTLLTAPISQVLEDPSQLGSKVPYYLAVYLLGSGSAVRWARDLFTAFCDAPVDEDTAYKQLDSAAARIEPGADGVQFLPYLTGRLYPRPNGDARGHIAGLRIQHQAWHIWRAILEAPGFVLATRLQEPLPHPITRLVASGGGARSKVWRQIISNMIGLPQSYSPTGNGALGAAFLAALGTGHASEMSTIQDGWLRDTVETHPDPAQVPVYRDLLARWQELDAQVERA